MSHIRPLHLPLTPAAADRLAASLSRYVPEAEDAPLLDALRTYLDQRLTALEHAFAATTPSSPQPSPSPASPLPSPSPASAQPDSSFGAPSAAPAPAPFPSAPAPAPSPSAAAPAPSGAVPPSSSPSAQPDSSFFILHSSFGAPAAHSSFGASAAASSLLRTLALALETTHLLGPDLRERALPLASRALAEASAIIDLAFPTSSPSSSAQPDSSLVILEGSSDQGRARHSSLGAPSGAVPPSAQPNSSFFTLHSSFGACASSSFLRAYRRLLHADPWAPPHEEEDARIRRLLRLIKSNPPTESGEMKP